VTSAVGRIARLAAVLALAAAHLLGCASPARQSGAGSDPDAVRTQIASLLPAQVPHREGWAVDIYAAFDALRIDPTRDNICAVLAVIAQESMFQVDPTVPDLPVIARREIDRRASSHGVPEFVVGAALDLRSPDGRTYGERLAHAHTEEALSDLYEDFIGMVPLGTRLFGGLNPIRTVGPMQVSVAYAERFAGERHYPYPLSGSIRHELFTRRGGVYFGVAHLLAYPAPYGDMIYRFADYNAGQYASRNAAFQRAASIASGTSLTADGDLLGAGGGPSHSELALRGLGDRIGLSEAQIAQELQSAHDPAFERTDLYQRVFALAERSHKSHLPRASIPKIQLTGPKISRGLTTEWYARRVDGRYRECRRE
jgi:hypothetical protein